MARPLIMEPPCDDDQRSINIDKDEDYCGVGVSCTIEDDGSGLCEYVGTYIGNCSGTCPPNCVCNEAIDCGTLNPPITTSEARNYRQMVEPLPNGDGAITAEITQDIYCCAPPEGCDGPLVDSGYIFTITLEGSQTHFPLEEDVGWAIVEINYLSVAGELPEMYKLIQLDRLCSQGKSPIRQLKLRWFTGEPENTTACRVDVTVAVNFSTNYPLHAKFNVSAYSGGVCT